MAPPTSMMSRASEDPRTATSVLPRQITVQPICCAVSAKPEDIRDSNSLMPLARCHPQTKSAGSFVGIRRFWKEVDGLADDDREVLRLEHRDAPTERHMVGDHAEARIGRDLEGEAGALVRDHFTEESHVALFGSFRQAGGQH